MRGLWKVLQEHDVCEETRENYSWWASFDAFCAFLTSKIFQQTTSSSVLTATSTLERAVKLISMLARSGRLESARVIYKLKMWTKKKLKMAKSWGKTKNLSQNSVFDRNFLWFHTVIFPLGFRSNIIFQSTLYDNPFRKLNLCFDADSFTSSLNFKACYDF